MADYTVDTAGLETPAVLGGTPSAGAKATGNAGGATSSGGNYVIAAVLTTAGTLVPVTIGQRYAILGTVTAPVTMGYTTLGIISNPFFMSGGVVSPVELDQNRMDKKIVTAVEVGGMLRAGSHSRGNVDVVVVMGAVMPTQYRVVGAVLAPMELGGGFSDGWLRALESAIDVGGDLRLGARVDDAANTPEVVVGQRVAADLGGIETPAELGGILRTGYPVSGGTVTPIVMGASFRVGAKITAPAIVTVIKVQGGLIADLATVASEDAEFANTGSRRALPLVAYIIGARTPADITEVPFGKPFTVAADFSATSGVFYESGAGPNFVGYRLGTQTKPVYVFRTPVPNEVLWDIHGPNRLIRYQQDPSTGKSSWKTYRSWPQRALDGVQVFDTFDPDRVYDYYATIMGALMSQLQRDNAVIRTMLDAEKCPKEYLSALATTFDAEFDAEDPEIVQRLGVQASVPTSRRRGFPDATVLRLRASGYVSNIFEVWTKIGWPALSTTLDDVTVVGGNTSSMISIGFNGKPTTPRGLFYFRSNYNPEPQEHVDVTYGVLSKRFYFSSIPVGAPGGSVAVTLGTSPNTTTRSFETMTNLVAAIVAWQAGIVVEGTAGPEFVLVPHSYSIAEPIGYWASRFVVVMLNKSNGDKVILDEDEKRIIRQRLDRALPVAARIKSFGTAAPAESEGVGCAETFTVAQV